MLSFSWFEKALPYDRFLAEHGSDFDRDRWNRTREAVQLAPEQIALLKLFTRTTNVLVLAGAWCGDCSGQCPAFEKFAEIAPVLKLRYLDRDVHADAQAELKICGGNRVPVAVFFSEDGHEVARFGERPLSTYRRMAAKVVPGIPAGGDALPDLVADWLREFERVQWILRLSPRLRKLHGD